MGSPSREDDVVSLTQELIAIDTSRPHGNETPAIELLTERLSAIGFEVTEQELPEARRSIVGRHSGGRGKPVGFSAHLDTVPVGDLPWSVRPLEGNIRDGFLYGRGSCDMKGGAAAVIVALQRLSREAFLGMNVAVFLSAGEENGCEGAALLRDAEETVELAALLVAEPTQNRLATGHKGALWLEASTTGRAAHSSMPHLGINAIYSSAEACLAVRDWFGSRIESCSPNQITANVGLFHGGTAINVVPDSASFTLDVRSSSREAHERCEYELRRNFESTIAWRTLLDLPPVNTPSSHPYMHSLKDLDIAGDLQTPLTMPFFTDASILMPACGSPPTLICGPGNPQYAHQIDERCSIHELMAAPGIFCDVFRRWAPLVSQYF